MTTLKLKLIRNKGLKIIVPNLNHEYGGIDLVQDFLFNHIWPETCVEELRWVVFFALVDAHGWKTEIREIDLTS